MKESSAFKVTTTYFKPDNSGVILSREIMGEAKSSVVKEAIRWISGTRKIYQFEDKLFETKNL